MTSKELREKWYREWERHYQYFEPKDTADYWLSAFKSELEDLVSQLKCAKIIKRYDGDERDAYFCRGYNEALEFIASIIKDHLKQINKQK